MIKITGGAFGEHNFSWSRRGQGWDGLRSEKGIRSGVVGNSLEVEETLHVSSLQSAEGNSSRSPFLKWNIGDIASLLFRLLLISSQ